MKKIVIVCLLSFLCLKNITIDTSLNDFIKQNEKLKIEIDRLHSEITYYEMKTKSLKNEVEMLNNIINSNPLTMGLNHYRNIIKDLDNEINDLTPGFIVWIKGIFSDQTANREEAYEKIKKYKIVKEKFKDQAAEFIEESISSAISVLENQIKVSESEQVAVGLNLKAEVEIAAPAESKRSKRAKEKKSSKELKKRLIEIEKSTIISLIRKIEIEKLKLLTSFAEL